jgi:hypothetical protein
MFRIERKKLILIVASVIVAVVATILIILSTILGGSDTSTKNPGVEVPTVEKVEPGMLNNKEDLGDNVSSTLLDNDFSKDIGYTPLPDGFDPVTMDTTNTVFDEGWNSVTLATIMCDLTNKNTISKRMSQPLRDISADMNKTGHKYSQNEYSTIRSWLEYFDTHDGERFTADKKVQISNVYCSMPDDSTIEYPE